MGLQAIFLGAIFCGLIYMLFDFEYNFQEWESWAFLIFILLCGGLVGYPTYSSLEILTAVFTVGDTHVSYRSLFKQRTIPISEIGGYQTAVTSVIQEKSHTPLIAIIPKDKSKKVIVLSQYIAHHHELTAWLGQHFELIPGRAYVDKR